jgi:hypothetical protein
MDGEIAALTVGPGEVAKGGAALIDGVGQDLLNRSGQSFEPNRRRATSRPLWVDPGSPQSLDRVNVADAGQQTLVEEKAFEGRPSGAK